MAEEERSEEAEDDGDGGLVEEGEAEAVDGVAGEDVGGEDEEEDEGLEGEGLHQQRKNGIIICTLRN